MYEDSTVIRVRMLILLQTIDGHRPDGGRGWRAFSDCRDRVYAAYKSGLGVNQDTMDCLTACVENRAWAATNRIVYEKAFSPSP